MIQDVRLGYASHAIGYLNIFAEPRGIVITGCFGIPERFENGVRGENLLLYFARFVHLDSSAAVDRVGRIDGCEVSHYQLGLIIKALVCNIWSCSIPHRFGFTSATVSAASADESRTE